METKVGAPFIEKPDEWSANEMDQQKLYCFLDKDRVCGGDCTAFDPDGDNAPRTPCLAINAVVSHAAILGSIRKSMIDSKRQSPIPGTKVPPPDVRT